MARYNKGRLSTWIADLLPRKFVRWILRESSLPSWSFITKSNSEPELMLLKHFLTRGSCFVDVGANLGQYIFFAKMLIKEENIIAFEPHPNLCSRLKEKYLGVTAFECALSDNQEVAQFKIPVFSQKEIHSRGKLNLDFNELEETDSRKIEVQVDTLDSVSAVLNRNNIDFIKIDVEGAEFNVLRGAVNTIKAHRPFLVVEIEQRHHKEPILDKIREFEAQNAYEAFYLDSVLRKIIRVSTDVEIDKIQDVSRHGVKRLYVNNFIFIPAEKNERGFMEDVSRRIARE